MPVIPDNATDIAFTDTENITGASVQAALAMVNKKLIRRITLRDNDGVPDVQQVADAAMTSGSAVLTSATAGFTAADVGKVIRVSMPSAGGKLATTIVSRQSATQVTLGATATATVSAVGATWGTDNGPALQSAMNLIVNNGGGELVIDGNFLIASPVDADLTLAGYVRISGIGTGGRLYIATPVDVDRTPAIKMTGARSVSICGVVFVGTPTEEVDAPTVLMFDGCGVIIDNCGFFWLNSVDEAGHAIIHTTGCLTHATYNEFAGCTGSIASGNAVVWCDDHIGARIHSNSFIDHGTLDGTSVTKTPITAPIAWVKVAKPNEALVQSFSQGMVELANNHFDEGALYGVLIGDIDGSHIRTAHVRLHGNYHNTSAVWTGPLGTAINIQYADHVCIDDCYIGYQQDHPHDAIYAANCTNVLIERTKCLQTSTQITFDTITTLTLRDVEYVTLAQTNVTTLNIESSGSLLRGSRVTHGVRTLAIVEGFATADVTTGNQFNISATANFTLDNPTGAVDGQEVTWRIKQDATGGRTIALGSTFRLPADISSVALSTAAGAVDYLRAVYDADDDAWDVREFHKAFAFVPPLAYRAVIQSEPNLINYWPMDEASGTTLTALVGGVNITLSGATPGVTGLIDGTAVQFDGVNDYGVTAATLDFSSLNRVMVECLLSWDSFSNNDDFAFEFTPATGSSSGGFFLDPNNSDGTIQAGLNGDVGFSATAATRPTGAIWHHFAIDFDKSKSADEVSIYIDGVNVGSVLSSFNTDNTNNFANALLYVMSRAGSTFFGAGKMQHLAIYSSLSASRILAHAQAAGLA